ncbi:hypothetical protein GGI07_004775 [Coemansia sp. Benny D115]|nr:hypothetical protein GGI07_004775 [Coemansia sp. Benny D115]
MSASDDTSLSLPALPCLELRTHPQRGRGVFTTSFIARGTLVHISPVLVFGAQEYREYGRHTQLDHYTYCWSNGGYALALGLGSMFNHEPLGCENVGFTRDMVNSLIRYTTLRDIEPGEELCICYGPNVWFDQVSGMPGSVATQSVDASEDADGFLQAFDLS